MKDPFLITELELLPDLFVALIPRENQKKDQTFEPYIHVTHLVMTLHVLL